MTSEAAACTAVTDALWRLRAALRQLASALSGAGDVPAAIDQLAAGEVLRAAETEELARTVGLPADATLSDLATEVHEPWRYLLLDHLTELRALYTEVTAVAALTGHRIWQQSLDDFLA